LICVTVKVNVLCLTNN